MASGLTKTVLPWNPSFLASFTLLVTKVDLPARKLAAILLPFSYCAFSLFR